MWNRRAGATVPPSPPPAATAPAPAALARARARADGDDQPGPQRLDELAAIGVEAVRAAPLAQLVALDFVQFGVDFDWHGVDSMTETRVTVDLHEVRRAILASLGHQWRRGSSLRLAACSTAARMFA